MDSTPKKYGRFIIEQLLGVGGAGKVFQAFDPERNESVALKVLHPVDAGEDNMSKLRFRREFRAASRLSHPHLVKVYETNIFEDQEYYTMEFVDGHDFEEHMNQFLAQLESEDPLNDPTYVGHILDAMIQIADALSYLHNQKFVHRDLKPGNILVGKDGRVRLADFGLVREMGSSQLTHTGSILGTVEYMSPEQTVTAKVDLRSDIYSLGIIAFRAFTGQLPFSGGLMQQLIVRTREEAPDPRTINSKLDRKIAGIISRMLKRRPEDRYANAQLLLDEMILLRDKMFGDSQTFSTSSLTMEAPFNVVLPPSCIGRDRELSRLQGFTDQLRTQKSGSLILISGETGIGKTRLLDELATHAAFYGLLVLKCSAPQQSDLDFNIWMTIHGQCFDEILQRRIHLSDELVRTKQLLEQLTTEFRNQDSAPGEAVKYKFFDSSNRFLSLLSREIPLIILLENMQWADANSAELLQFISRRTIFPQERGLLPEQLGRLMIVVTFRDGELRTDSPINRFGQLFNGESGYLEMHLERLSANHVKEMIISMLGGEHASPNFADRISQVTEGNPLFVESTINNLVEEKLLRRRGGIWVGATSITDSSHGSDSIIMLLPASLKESARRRISGLDQLEKELVQCASILNEVFSFDEVMYLADMDEDTVLDSLDGLLKARFLLEKSSDEELYIFTSHHLREVLYDDLSDDQKVTLHLRAAEYLEEQGPDLPIPDLCNLANHYIEAKNRSKAFPICQKMAKYFIDRSNVEKAYYYVDQALKLTSPETYKDIDELRLMKANCLKILGRMRESQDLYQQLICDTSRQIKKATSAVSSHGPLKLQGRALLGLAQIHKVKSHLNIVRRFLKVILQKSHQCGDRNTFINAMALLGTIAMHQGHMENALKNLNQALHLASENDLKEEMAICHHNIGNIYFTQNNFDEALKHYQSALEIHSKNGNESKIAATKTNIGNIYKQKDQYHLALKYYEESAKTAEIVGDFTDWPLYLHNLATIQLRMGKYEQAIINFRKAIVVFEDMDSQDQLAMCLNNLGKTYSEAGRHEEALMIFHRAHNIFKSKGYNVSRAITLINMGVMCIELDLFEKSETFFKEAFELYKRLGASPGFNEGQVAYSRLCIRNNKLEEAEKILIETKPDNQQGNVYMAFWYQACGELAIELEKSGVHRYDAVDLLEKSINKFNASGHFGSRDSSQKILGQYLISSGRDPHKGDDLLDSTAQLN